MAIGDGDRSCDPAASASWVRLSFPRPVHCRHDLAHLLHPVLFHGRHWAPTTET